MRSTACEYISGEEFQKVIQQIKQDRGLSWAEMGTLTGRSKSTMAKYGNQTAYTVSKRVAEDILQRLAGVRMPPTRRQQAEYTSLARKGQSDMRAETLQMKKIDERKSRLAKLRESLG